MKLKRKNNLILISLIMLGIGLILSSLFIILSETKPAKEFCNSVNQTYTFNNFNHKCNGNQIFQYNSVLIGEYWGFTSNEDSKITLPEEWNKVPTNP